ncbi:MAG: hypothetical protein DHS20C15_29800 [Planctomycetota bacterium]|nr:MAG: hypothetical protein DHS20C15_29800 [Planctomycetota bacterium]
MFHDPNRFPVLRALTQATPIFQSELEDLCRDDFLPWPDRGAYVGGWLLFPLFAAKAPTGFAVDYAAHRRRCPRSMDVLRDHPRVFSAAFSWLDPGGHVTSHLDEPRAYNLRAQLGLRINGDVPLRSNGETRRQRAGEMLLFDTRYQHEIANASSSERIALVLDFEYSLDEEAGLIAEAEMQAGGQRIESAGGFIWRRGW